MGAHPSVGLPETREQIVARISKLIAVNYFAQSAAETLAGTCPACPNTSQCIHPRVSRDERIAWLSGFNEDELRQLEYSWDFWARPKQRFPTGNWNVWLLTCGRGYGKALDITTPIPTPDGWVPIGDLQIGDLVFGSDGKPVDVIGAYDLMLDHPCYRVQFDDGSEIIADADHEWMTWDKRARKTRGRVAPAVRTTLDIRDTLKVGKDGRETNHSVEIIPTILPDRELPIAPYTLGIWLGDGASAGASLTTDDPEILFYIAEDGYAISANKDPLQYGIGSTPSKRGLDGRMQSNDSLHSTLKRCNLVHNKHIPMNYLRSGNAQRLALLQGLLDSDGHYNVATGATEFSSVNCVLANDFLELVLSLGFKAHLYEGLAKLDGRIIGPKYSVAFSTELPVFRLKRKLDTMRRGQSQRGRTTMRYITNVEPVNSRPVRCIKVSASDGLFIAGKNFILTHNTRTGAEWVRDKIESGTYRHMALVAANAKDLRRVIVEDIRGGGSGLLQICPPWNMPEYEPSKMRLTWTNPNYKSYGASCSLYSAEEPNALRGPAHDGAWCDELAKWDRAEECWDMLKFGLRIGIDPQIVVTTTPKPTIQFMKLWRRALGQPARDGQAAILPDPKMRVTTGSTFENQANLSSNFLQDVLNEYEGTRTGKQELYADVLIDIEGALWTLKLIEQAHLPKDAELPILRTRIVGVDPQMSFVPGALTGIVVCGQAAAHRGNPIRGYVLADRSMNGTPKEWAKAICDAYWDYECSLVVAERNQGGELVEDNIHNVDPNVKVKLITSSKSKGDRAIPVVSRYEQGRVFHHGSFPFLESEQMTYVPGDEMKNKKKSPNRVDAAVHALNFLLVGGLKAGVGISIGRRI